MPPEQQAAMKSFQASRPVEVTVDGRTDIYALGAILYESLGGQLPLTPDSPLLSRVNPQVSAGLSDIVARCTAPSPEDRYANARTLADDLRRHLTDQPLLGVVNRSLAERWRKWRRRRPATLRLAGIILIIAGAAAILLAATLSNLRDRRQQAQIAVSEGQRQLESQHFAEAVRTFERGLSLADRLPLARDLRHEMRDQLATARRLHLAQQLHQLANEVRALYPADSIPPQRLRSLASQCTALWQRRGVITEALGPTHAPNLAADLKDIAIFAASASDGPQVLRLLDEAEATFGPSAVLEYQRRALGQSQITNDKSPIPPSPHRTAWEHYALGRALLSSGDVPRAAQELSAALKLDPAGCWPNFYWGLCAHRMGRHDDAVAAFSVCIGAAPNVAGCYYNRALAYTALGRPEQALHDYNRALQIDPANAAAALNRGMIHFQQKRFEQAIADLSIALKHGADPATVHYDLALTHLACNDTALALQHVQRALEYNSTHNPSRKLHDALGRRMSIPKTVP
jgi:tetratricopeptide (TPR) repeat protein